MLQRKLMKISISLKGFELSYLGVQKNFYFFLFFFFYSILFIFYVPLRFFFVFRFQLLKFNTGLVL